jgi:hypothetical protein
MEANDIITAITNQRNGAMNEVVQLFAMLEAEKRKVAELEKQLGAKNETPADSSAD